MKKQVASFDICALQKLSCTVHAAVSLICASHMESFGSLVMGRSISHPVQEKNINNRQQIWVSNETIRPSSPFATISPDSSPNTQRHTWLHWSDGRVLPFALSTV